VLYLLHGFGSTRDEWVSKGGIAETADRLIAVGTIPPCLIVMPSAGESWYLDRQERMETAFIRDLLPEIESRYAALPARRGRLLAGVSMGGYGALRFALRYPDTFAAAALMSPAIYDPLPPAGSASRRSAVFMAGGSFDPGLWQHYNYPTLLDRYRAGGRTVPLYVAAGSEDELNIGGHVQAMARLWEQLHWPGTFRLLHGRHNFEMWRRVLPDALRYLFHPVDAHLAAAAGKGRGAGAPPSAPWVRTP
jgi:enterochelin esterase-like enzyme